MSIRKSNTESRVHQLCFDWYQPGQSRSANIQTTLKLIDAYPWDRDGVTDKWEVLREIYGDYPTPQLIQRIADGLDAEGYL